MSFSENSALEAGSQAGAQNGVQVVQKVPPIAGENEGFATTVGPQEAVSVAKPDLLDPPNSTTQLLTSALARIASTEMQEILAVAVTQERVVIVNRGGRPESLDKAARQKVCLLLKLGYTRSLAAAELGVARSTITRTMQRDPEFREQVVQSEALFERTPLLTIVEAAQRDWRAAAWLMKNYQPHSSVSRRKARQKMRENARESKEWFRLANESMDAGFSKPGSKGDVKSTVTRKGTRKVVKQVSR